MDQALKSLRWIWQWELSNCIYVCVYLRVCALTKSRKESQIRLLFSPTSYFYFVFISKGTIVYGEGSRVFFSSLFSAYFSFSLFVSFKGNYSPGPFQLSNATKGNPASSLPCPHTRLFLWQKQPLLGSVIISQRSFFIPQVRNTLLLYIKATSHECLETWDVAADALPMDNFQLDKLGSDRCSQCFLFLQAGCLAYYMSWLSIYLQYAAWH